MSKEKLVMDPKYADEVLARLRAVEHRSLDNEQRSRRNKEDLAAVETASKYDESVPHDMKNLRQRLEKVEGVLCREDSLSPNEKCLVYMYRYLVANEGDEKEMVLRADSRGFIGLGFG